MPPINNPDSNGRFGDYGGQFVPETLIPAIQQLTDAYATMSKDQSFGKELADLGTHYTGRPTPLYYAERLTQQVRGARIYLKREDLAHTGAHKINNALGQALLAKKMGKHRIVAETGAGQHGVATATVCAMMGLQCIVYMGTEDMRRQEPNVYRMRMLNADVRAVDSGTKTLKDAINEAIRDWVTNVDSTHYLIGSVVGPHPYPVMVRDFQSIIGTEARRQMLELTERLPSYVVASVGGGSNAIGIFHAFRDDDVNLIGIEAGGEGMASEKHAATLSRGRPGVLHGSFSYLLQDANGQIQPTHSVSAGLDYPGVGPEHSFLKDTGRAHYMNVTDDRAIAAFKQLCAMEGIIPALESSHAIAYVLDTLASSLSPEQTVLINLSGRGDKDLQTVMDVDAVP